MENAIIHKAVNKHIHQNNFKKEKRVVLLIIQNIFIKGELGREMYVSVNFFLQGKAKQNNFKVTDFKDEYSSVDGDDINIVNEITKSEDYIKSEIKDAYIVNNSDKPLNDDDYNYCFR